jgi:mannose-6-phosphate isomerase-like protein (cupin superfamily)
MLRDSRKGKQMQRLGLGILFFAAASMCVAAASARGDAAPAVLDAATPTGRITLPLAQLAAQEGLAPGEDFKIRELFRDAGTSQHVVWIRDREQPHRHDRHDLVVVILKGEGFMRLGDEERAVGVGSILYVPRGMVHAFRNTANEPAAAYAIYTPAFDGKDREPVE